MSGRPPGRIYHMHTKRSQQRFHQVDISVVSKSGCAIAKKRVFKGEGRGAHYTKVGTKIHGQIFRCEGSDRGGTMRGMEERVQGEQTKN